MEVEAPTPSALDAKLAAAFVAFQAELTPVPKSADNPFFHSKYADAGAVQRHVGPLLAKHKLAVMQPIRKGENGKIELVTRLVHESGAYVEEVTEVTVAKSDAQAKGSGITYERRYAYMAILGVVADDEDDDGNVASNRRPQESQQQTAAASAKSELTSKLGKLMKQLAIGENEKADFFLSAIGKERPATISDVEKAIKHAEAIIADEEEAAKELGQRS